MEDVFWGLMIPLLGTTLGAACVFFHAGTAAPIGSARPYGICIGCDGGCFVFQSAPSGTGAVGAYGAVGVPSRGDRFRCGCGVSSVFGSHYSSSAHERGNGGRAEEPPEEDDDAHFGGDAP